MTQYYSNQDWYNQNQQPASWGAGGYNQQQTEDVGDDFEGELPLLQELGINFSHIKAKTFAVLNPFRSVSSDVIADQDLAGPLVFCLLFGSSLLLQGKMQFGYIYGIGALGCIGIYVLLNLMAAEKAISFTCTTSILGYCLLPMAILSLLVAFLNFEVGVEAFVSVNSLMECIQKFCDGLIVTKKCEADDSWTVHPSTGYVLKFKQVKSTIAGEKCKFFWNICHCTEVPPPINDYDEDAVSKILDSDDPSRYRIPLSVGELETISDHGQNDSLKTDIIVNSTFFMKRLQKNEFFQHLLLLVSAEAVEKKHGIKVDWTDAIFLKKRSSIGGLKLQRIRKKPANAFIEETRESRIDEKDEAFALENRPPSNCMITLRNGCTVEVLVKFPAECAPIDDVESKLRSVQIVAQS